MKVVKTQAALKYQDEAYLIHLDSNNFLCIDSTEDEDAPIYKIGEVVELEDYEIDLVDKKEAQKIISNCPLADTFLFDFFLLFTRTDISCEDACKAIKHIKRRIK